MAKLSGETPTNLGELRRSAAFSASRIGERTVKDELRENLTGCEIHDNPYRPICRRRRDLVEEKGDATGIAWLPPEERYVEKLATPDVTIADTIGDIDPIEAARQGQNISGKTRTVH
jgi:magnesium chelatase subunit I